MTASLVLLHTAICIVGIIALIMVVRLNAAVALVIGSLYLGIATGLGAANTVDLVAQGFGSLMTEVGLVIGFGIMLGSILSAMGALQRIVDGLLRLFGSRGAPYAFSLSTATVFPAIYFDVTLMLLGPMARAVAARTGLSIAAVGGALAAGLEVGLLLVPPGVAALATAGALGVPVGTMFLYGLLIGVPTAVLTTTAHIWLMKRAWKPAKDEVATAERRAADEPGTAGGPGVATVATTEGRTRTLPSLPVALAPILAPLLLIATGAIAGAVGHESDVIEFVGSGIVALLVGLLLAVLLACRTLSREERDHAITEGLKTSGLILLFTGVAGSLSAVLAEAGIAEIVAGLFAATTFAPLLLVWVVAAFLRIAQGSATVAALTAAGILAPIVDQLGVSPILAALAAGSGAAFGAHINDNSFWIFNTLMGATVRGTFKLYSLPQAMVAVISLPLVLLLGVFL
jgi:GntP family gluconate:H+ symporter